MKKVSFEDIQSYKSDVGYHLLPFRFAGIPNSEKDILISNEVGEFIFTDREVLKKLIDGTLSEQDRDYNTFLGKHIISTESGMQTAQRLLSAKYRTKKSMLKGGPALHIFVVTLRCDHSCPYCQVSRQNAGNGLAVMRNRFTESYNQDIFFYKNPEGRHVFIALCYSQGHCSSNRNPIEDAPYGFSYNFTKPTDSADFIRIHEHVSTFVEKVYADANQAAKLSAVK